MAKKERRHFRRAPKHAPRRRKRTLGQVVMTIVRKPVSRVVAPALTATGVAEIFLSDSTTAKGSLVGELAYAVENGFSDPGSPSAIVVALKTGLKNALPELLGGAAAALAGKVTHT